MDNYIENYKNIEKEVRQRISCDMIKVIGLDNLLYATVNAMVCECIDENMPRDKRREFIMDRIHIELDRWCD